MRKRNSEECLAHNNNHIKRQHVVNAYYVPDTVSKLLTKVNSTSLWGRSTFISFKAYEKGFICIFTEEKTDPEMLSNLPQTKQLVSGIVGFESSTS